MGLRSMLSAVHGRLRPIPFTIDPQLDAEFYRASNPDLGHLSRPVDLQRHFALHGRDEGRFPNEAVALGTLEKAYGRLPPDFDPSQYQRLNPDLRANLPSAWASVEHYLRYGRAEGRRYFDFDAELYKALHLGGRRLSDAAALSHYLSEGRRAGLVASWAALMTQRGVPGAAWVSRLHTEEFALLNWWWAPDVSTRLQAVDAMLAEGVERLAPIAFQLSFDPAYYRELHPSLGPRTDPELYRLWLFDGLERDEPGSATQHLKRLKLDLEAYPGAFQWRDYARAAGVRHATRWSALDHFIHSGLGRGAEIPVSETAGSRLSGECLAAFSGAFAFRDDRLAIRLGEAARKVGMEDATTLQGLADCYLRQQRWPAALDLYERVAPCPEANVWTFTNGVRAALNAARSEIGSSVWHERALDLVGRGKDRVAGDPQFRIVVREVIEAIFAVAVQESHILYLAGDRTRADDVLLAAAERAGDQWATLDPIGAPLQPTPTARVVMLANTDLPQCTRYRVDQKAELFEVLGLDYQIFNAGEVDGFISALPGACAAIFYRLPAFPMVVRAMDAAKAIGVATFYEIDDLLFTQAYPEPLETYGGSITPETYAGLQFGVPLFRAAMARCQYGLTSTTALAHQMRPLVQSGEVFVVPNGLDASSEAMLSRPPSRVHGQGDLVVFYGSGTKAHNSDFLMLAGPALAAIMRRRPEVRVVIVGYLTLDEWFEGLEDRIVALDFTPDIRAYWSLLAEADVNLAVLQPNEITDAKSEIKWLEAATLGIPSIVSDTKTFRDVVTDGVDGVIARDVDSWRRALEQLIDDADLRSRMGAAARDKAARLYGVQANAARLKAALRPALERVRSSAERGKDASFTQRRRILLVNVFFPPQTIGGATRVVRDNLDQLLDGEGRAFDFAVVTSDNAAPAPGSLRIESYRGVPVFRLSTPGEARMDWRALNPELGAAFSEILQIWRPDVVHFHAVQRLTASTLQACIDAGVPYVVTAHDAWWISDWQFLVDDRGRVQPPCPAIPLELPEGVSAGDSLARRRVLSDLLGQAQAVLGVSETFTNIYRKCGYARSIAVPNGVSVMEPLARTSSSSGRVRLAQIGGQSAHKGYRLVEAVLKRASFANLELTVVDHARFGGAHYQDIWGATPVSIIGKTRQEQMNVFYATQDVLLAPSIWPESFGLVTREALDAGLWVVTSDRGALAEDVRPGVNGLVVDVSNPQPLYDALAAIDADPVRYLQTPPAFPLRRSVDQARDLARLYETWANLPKGPARASQLQPRDRPEAPRRSFRLTKA